MNALAPARAGETSTRETAARIAAEIEREVVTGVLGPGERLAEVALSRRFGVGRAPVREALRTLEGRRLVERTPNAGARVVTLTAADVGPLLELREVLEGLSARLAAERITLNGLKRLDAMLAKGSAPSVKWLGGSLRSDGTDHDFHTALAQEAGNTWLIELLSRDLYALLRIVRFRAASQAERAEEAHAEHVAIVKAVRAREPQTAEALMRAHVRRSRAVLEAALFQPSERR